MAIRRAALAEAATLAALARDAYGHYVARIGREPAPMADDYGKRVEDGEAYVLDDGGIVGFVVLVDVPPALLLDNVAVAPAAQGRGYGRRLVDFAEAEARRRGHGSVELYTHALMSENLALYRRLGFVETHRVREHGFDRVYMTRQLSQPALCPGAHPAETNGFRAKGRITPGL